jgi:hypothetical protein
MSIPATYGSAVLLKRNCQIVAASSVNVTTPPTTEDWAQHPALNLAMDGIAIYANWVSQVVMPIAFLWIEANKQEICSNKGWKVLPDDVNEVINAAFEIASQDPYYRNGQAAFDQFQNDLRSGALKPDTLNQSWTAISKSLRAEIHKSFPSCPDPQA